MAKIKYEESRADRDRLRDALRRNGRHGVDAVAQALRERWHHGHLRSYRLALELSQPEVCNQVNGLQGSDPGDPGYLDSSTLSKFEHFPTTGRRPNAGYLVALAQVFGTSPRNLIADADWDSFPAPDRLIVRAVDQATRATRAATPGGNPTNLARPPAGATRPIPPNPWGTPEWTRPGNPTERLVLMTGEESAQYADRGGNLGELTLDQLRTAVTEQAHRFANADRLALFGTVRLLRDRLFAYLDGGQPLRQRRDLYFLAAATCGMLANTSSDLGYPGAAMSQARAAHVFAMEAGDPVLTAWLYAQQSTFCYWNGQPGKAREYARRGAALKPGGTIGVWLPAVEARACGELGDTEGVRNAVRRATEARDLAQTGTLDQFGGIMVINQAKQHFYAAGAFLGIDDDPAVITHATAAVEMYQDGPSEDCAYDNIAACQFHTAIAHVRVGDLDSAQDAASAAFQTGGEHRSAHVDKAARRLHAQLRAPAVRTSPLAIETRDQIENFLSTTPTHPHLS